jgi:carboxypeptidase Q
MRRLCFTLPVLLCLGLAGLGAPVRAQEPPAGFRLDPAIAEADNRLIAEIRGTQYLMANLEYLSDMIGPRLTGSEKMRRANDWTAEKFREYGLSNVHLEPSTRWRW